MQPESTRRDPVTIVMSGVPVPYARTRIDARGALFNPKKQRNAMATLRVLAQMEMGQRQPFDEPVVVDLSAEMPIPASWSKRKQQQAVVGEIAPSGRPDLSNLAKLAEDALNGIVYRDDALIVAYRTLWKRYSLSPKLIVTVAPWRAAA